MKQSFARTLLYISLIFSLISFILSLIALHLPKWKTISLRDQFHPMTMTDHQPMDPLIRGELEKYIDVLYRRGEVHSFGLSSHCLIDGRCGENLLLTFDETHYGLCHQIHSHHQCIFSPKFLANSDGKCRCEQPFYSRMIHKLLILFICLQLIFIILIILRLSRDHCRKRCCNDIQLRLICLICALFEHLFLIIIFIQQSSHRFDEPLAFFEAMRRHYSRIQIYTFSKDLEFILQQIEQNIDIRMGASFICLLFTLVFTFVAFVISISVEMKITLPAPISITFNDDMEEKPPIACEPVVERFIPSEQIRFTRQTKV